jgi:hypothetical protein
MPTIASQKINRARLRGGVSSYATIIKGIKTITRNKSQTNLHPYAHHILVLDEDTQADIVNTLQEFLTISGLGITGAFELYVCLHKLFGRKIEYDNSITRKTTSTEKKKG